MSVIEIPVPGNRGFDNPRVHQIDHVHEQYDITSFTEEEWPEGAFRAQQIQGESYQTAEFICATARDEDGRMHPDLDRSRGSNVTYFLANPKRVIEGRSNQGAMRIVDVPVNGTVRDLAAFRYSESTMHPNVAAMLRAKVEKEGPGSVREVGALSHTDDGSTRASFELIRLAVQQAIRGKTEELWIITFAPRAYRSIIARFSPNTVLQIGAPVAVDVGDPRTSDSLRLTPVLIDPCRLPDQMVDYLLSDMADERGKRYVVGTLYAVLDGLRVDELSDYVKEYIASLERGVSA
ncbi:MAG: hypothetical protein WBP12_03015 [Candidatus Saccharimonas sp.]